MRCRHQRVAREQKMSRAMQLVWSSVRGLILAAALAGCAHTPTAALDDTRWTLAGWSISSQQAEDSGITAAFSNGKITGHSGVNTYGGTYATTAAGAFSVASLSMTEMAGPEPLMRAEGAYMTLLGQAASYGTRDGRLTLYDRGGNESLVFELVPR